MRSATMKELAPNFRGSNNFHCLRLTLKLFNGNAQMLKFETFACLKSKELKFKFEYLPIQKAYSKNLDLKH